MTRNLIVTLLTMASVLAACNNSKSEVTNLSEDAGSKGFLLKAKDATIAIYKGEAGSGNCMVSPGAMLAVSTVSNSNVSSVFENIPNNGDMYLARATDGSGLKKFDGAYSDAAAGQSKLIKVLCEGAGQNRDFVLICSNWAVFDDAGENQLSDKLCGFEINKVGQPQSPSAETHVSASVEHTIELTTMTPIKLSSDGRVPVDLDKADYCQVQKGVYRLKAKKELIEQHYKFTLAEPLTNENIIGGFLAGHKIDSLKTACKAMTFYVEQENAKGE